MTDHERELMILDSQWTNERITRIGYQLWVCEVKQLLSDLRDNLGTDCRLDHHGYCQEHFLEENCVVKRIGEFLNGAELHERNYLDAKRIVELEKRIVELEKQVKHSLKRYMFLMCGAYESELWHDYVGDYDTLSEAIAVVKTHKNWQSDAFWIEIIDTHAKEIVWTPKMEINNKRDGS